ncbi:MAG: FlgD immunoglobulin-like domain containing protein [Candidatus Cloacimonadota bacterium]|nr:FlgD immunoglobulin-like domain containing protein [Candidatus Cloacimonadota bacterium]
MKKLLIVLFVVTISLLNAQIQWNEEIPIRQGVNIEWYRSATGVDGGVVFVWSDTRTGVRDVWAQKYDANGNCLWTEGGILVNGEYSRQEDPVIIESGNGDVIIAWVDFRNEEAGDIYAQKISSDGVLQWAEEGVPLCLFEDIQISLNIVPDDNGGAYVIWLDSRPISSTDIYGTHIDTNGNIVSGWADDGNPIANASGSQNQHTFWEDGSNGAIVAWHDERDPYDANIYMQRITSNGDLLWGENGNLLTGVSGPQEKPKITPDGTGNFIFSWRDMGTDNFGDIKAQRVDLNGDLLWTNEVEIYVGEAIQRNARITKASDNGAIIVWEDGRNEASENYKDLYAQKLDINGNLQWNTSGVEVVQALNDQLNPRLNGDDNGGAWIIWEDGRVNNHPYEDIYIQHVNSNGTFELPVNGFNVCSADGWQFSPLVKLSENKVFCVWGDNRTGSTGLYVQLLDTYGNTILEDDGEIIYYGLCGDSHNQKILTNNDKKIVIWEDTRNAGYGFQIYYQIVNDNGSLELEEDGQPVTTLTGYDQESMDADIYPDSDILGMVWEENKLGYKQVYGQAIDLEGNMIWSQNEGLQLGESDAEQSKPKISIVDNNSILEYYVGWEDFAVSGDSRIVGQKIVNGNLEWGVGGKTIVDRAGNDKLSDVSQGYYVWQSIGGNTNIFCIMVDENGDPATGWDAEGLDVCIEDGNQNNARIMDVPDGLLIVWDDYRNGSIDIYGQIVTPEGTILWEDGGVPLVDVENDQFFSNMIYNDAIFIVWTDFRTGSFNDIYMQKFDMNGNEIWQTGGVEVIVQESYQEAPYLVTDGINYMVFWEDYSSGFESELLAQMLDENGEKEITWPNTGLTICSELKNQNAPKAVNDGEYSYVIWEDTRSSGKTDIYNVYLQKVKFEPVGVDDPQIHHPGNILMQNYPNPFNPTTNIDFSLKQDSFVSLKIYNVRGQKVRTLVTDEMQAGYHSVVWNGKNDSGKNVSSGIYFSWFDTKNENGDYTSVKKMILLK